MEHGAHGQASIMDIRGSRKPRLGSGERFAALKARLAREGARSPGGLAAHIGREKHGAGMMASLAAAGRRRR